MYWARHLRATVRFAEGIQELWKDPARVLLEVGPRTTATTLARQQAKDMKKQAAIPSLSDTHENETEWTSLLKAVGQLWLSGASINWTGFYAREKRRRIPLPTYSFERTRYWLEPAFTTSLSASLSGLGTDPAAPPMEARAAAVPGPEEGTPGVPKTRRERLVPILRKLLQETSGMDLSSADESTTYLEMGLDSLFLTQIARRLHKEFGARITFRQMLEEYPTLKKTAEFLDKQMPPDAPAEETGSLRLEVAGTETREPTASSLKPTVYSLQPEASSLKPQAYSLEQDVARQTEIISQLAGMLEERGVALPPEMREAIQKEKLAREPTPEKPRAERQENGLKPALRTGERVPRAERQENGLKPALRTGERVPPSPAARPAAFPPVPGARLGRDPEGNPAWYMPDPSRPGKYLKVGDTL
jgi:acyl transferase domain-containing protein